MTTRAFKVVMEIDGQPWTWIRTFAPEHSPSEVTAAEFLPLLEPEVGETLATCTTAAKDYLLDAIDDDPVDLASSITSVEEL